MKINAETKFNIGQEVYVITRNLKNYIVMPVTIEEIQVSKKAESYSYSIWYIDGIMKYCEPELIETLEVAEAQCAELNREIINNEN